MKTKTYLKVSFIVAFFISSNIQAQEIKKKSTTYETSGSNYKLGLGLRAGLEGGFTFKYFIKSNAALEGILSRGWGYGGARFTGLYEIQKKVSGTKGLSWFYGIGGHIGYYNGNYYGYTYYNGGYYDKNGKWHSNSNYKNNYATIGIDGILGLEYVFTEIPFSIGIDIKPYIDFIGGSNRFTDGAFSLRYIIQ